MKVLLVDDHALFIGALRGLLEVNGIEVTGTAANGQEALDRVRTYIPDVVLMDIRMPGSSGLEGLRLIKAEFPQVHVVMLTMSGDDDDLFAAIQNGASGYILKDAPVRDFFDLLAGVTQGRAAVSMTTASRIMGELARPSQQPQSPMKTQGTGKALTPRQTEVLRGVAQGLTYKEIAAAQDISERTVNYHVGEIMEKLSLDNRAQMITYAARLGLDGSESGQARQPARRRNGRG